MRQCAENRRAFNKNFALVRVHIDQSNANWCQTATKIQPQSCHIIAILYPLIKISLIIALWWHTSTPSPIIRDWFHYHHHVDHKNISHDELGAVFWAYRRDLLGGMRSMIFIFPFKQTGQVSTDLPINFSNLAFQSSALLSIGIPLASGLVAGSAAALTPTTVELSVPVAAAMVAAVTTESPAPALLLHWDLIDRRQNESCSYLFLLARKP